MKGTAGFPKKNKKQKLHIYYIGMCTESYGVAKPPISCCTSHSPSEGTQTALAFRALRH